MLVNRNGIILNIFEGVPENRQEIFSFNSDFIVCRVNPFDSDGADWLRKQGFFFADRQLDCRVSLKTLPESHVRQRFQIQINSMDYRNAQEIYRAAFVHDRRFHLRPAYDNMLADCVIEGYVAEAVHSNMTLLSCYAKEQALGCAYLQAFDKELFVYLAAILPHYQGTGASVELYRACANYARKIGKRTLTGRVSASNTAVINLYATLRANFSHSVDVYILERKG